MSDRRFKGEIGVGATNDLSLRVSVATLVRFLFPHPENGQCMLALERKATVQDSETRHTVEVKSQPFGGAIQVHNFKPLQGLIGDFHFDSEESQSEKDLRIFIRPADWEAVREFCFGHLSQPNDPVLEFDPARELSEEFADALGIELQRDQYTSQAIGTIVEDLPSATENTYARGYHTTRIYRIFEVQSIDPSLASTMLKNNESCSDQDLREFALESSRSSGSGRANAVLTLPFEELCSFYSAITLEARNKPISFHNHQLDETVTALVDDLTVPKYRRL